MWITQVELHNIKSYGKRTTIDLAQGVNAICGKNGAGKSTILEAIGLTLFGKSAYKNQEQFIHEKAKKGQITITLFDSRDERLYQVIRPIKGGPPYVYDPETKRELASGVEDVQRWLRDCIRVEPTTDLKALFENAIGVTQGLLTVSFLETEANRRKVFDPLLNVEDYKQAYDRLRAVNTQVREWENENTAQQARLEGQLEALPGYLAEVQDLAQKIQTAEGQLSVVTVKLNSLAERLAGMEEQKEQVGRLAQQVDRLVERLAAEQTYLQTAQAEFDQAQQAQAVLEEAEASHRAYEQAQKERDKLEENRKIREEIRQRLGETERQVAKFEQNLAHLQKQLQEVASAEARLVELAPQVEQQQSLEQELQQAQTAVASLKVAEKRLFDEAQRQQILEQELANSRIQLQQRQTLTQEIEALEQQRRQQLTALNTLSDELAGLDQQLASLNRSLQEAQGQLSHYQSLQERIQEAARALPQRQEKLRQMQAEASQRQELEAQQETLDQRRKQRQAELASLEVQLSDQEAAARQTQQTLNEWERKRQALENHQANLTGMEERLARAQADLANLEAGVNQRQQILAEITALEAEGIDAGQQRDTVKDNASRYKAKLAEINDATAALNVEADSPCPVCRKPLSGHDIGSLKEHYQAETEHLTLQLAEAETTLQTIENQLKQAQRQTKKRQGELERLPNQAQVERQQQLVAGYEAEAASLQAEMTPLAAAPTQVDHLQQEVDRLQAALADLKQAQAGSRQADQADERQQQKLQSQIGQLARPVDIDQLEAELKELQTTIERWTAEAEPLAGAPQRLADLQAADQALSAQKAERQNRSQALNQEREQLAQQIHQRQTQMNELASPGRIDQLQAELTGQQAIVAEWQGKVAELAPAPEQLNTIKTELDRLGDPRRHYGAAEAEAAKRPALEAQLTQLQAQFQAAQEAKKGIEGELLPFAHLDHSLEQVNATLSQSRAAHQTYLEHKATAELLPQREARVSEFRQRTAGLMEQQEEASQELAKAQASYDPADHQAKAAEQDETRTEYTRLETQLAGHHHLLPQAQAKVDALAAVAAELSDLKQEGERLVRLQEVVDFIRRTIRDAGPEITRRLVKAISLRAGQIFADIVNDYQQELIWDENYGITIHRDGYVREFQQLSGGEAMAAALAVRLALLQSMSAIDVAFFDEPTANLDPERRANLAEQIARIKGFSQLVVISHDDTFEQDTGHVIHIAKDEQGYSQVI